MKQLKIILMGSPRFACLPLESLCDHPQLEVVAVVSQPAKEFGRGKKVTPTPVSAFAMERDIPLYCPEKASDPEFLQAMRDLEADIVVTAAYGKILTKAFLAIPKLGTLNIHPSRLPAYRGATPVQSALLNGEVSTAVSILFTIRELDAGPLVLCQDSDIGPDETAPDLLMRLFALGAELVVKACFLLQDSSFVSTEQQHERATFCDKIEKSDGLIDWAQPSSTIYNRYRAFAEWPKSHTYFRHKRVIIHGLEPASDNPCLTAKPGSFFYDESVKKICVRTGESTAMWISRLQTEGKKELHAREFWHGLKGKGFELLFGGAS